MNALEVRRCGEKGRGIFAGRDFAEAGLVERAPVIILPPEERAIVKQTILSDYYFNWPFVRSEQGVPTVAVVLGYGSLYNHSYTPNLVIKANQREQAFDFIALRDIRCGEELTHNYTGFPNSRGPVGFDVLP